MGLGFGNKKDKTHVLDKSTVCRGWGGAHIIRKSRVEKGSVGREAHTEAHRKRTSPAWWVGEEFLVILESLRAEWEPWW